ncbi:TetR/AcrR family transcriptional regulator [Roseibium sp.]|uniref:TetR/AcrR family transcriptional regulator n=1 Tax=Roseibium sp. TaxID=1936156 RepID=UPI003BAE85F7
MGRKKNYERTDVLAKARDCFWRSGYEGAHLSDLVEATGLNRFSLYKEFDGKAGLFLEALELYAQEAKAFYDGHLCRDPLGLANIRAYFDALKVEPDYQGCFIVNTLTEQATVPGAAFNVARNFVDQVEERFRNNLIAALKNGDLADDTDVTALARTLVCLDNGIAVFGIVRPDQSVVKTTANLYLDAVLKPA